MGDEYMECHWLFNNKSKEVAKLERKLDRIENYLYDNQDIISKKIYNDLLDILWSRKNESLESYYTSTDK